jgi:hypothetical protein
VERTDEESDSGLRCSAIVGRDSMVRGMEGSVRVYESSIEVEKIRSVTSVEVIISSMAASQ